METSSPMLTVQRLHSLHHVTQFTCGVASLDAWLEQYALQNDKAGYSRTWVVTDVERPLRILAYFSISACSVEYSAEAKEVGVRRIGRYAVPSILLGRLAVAQHEQGKGLGDFALAEALVKIVETSQITGVAMVVVDALNEHVERFYDRYGFVSSLEPLYPRRMYLSLKKAEAALKASQAENLEDPPA